MAFFFIKKPLQKHVFCNAIFITDRLNKVITKLKNVIKSFEMTLNSKHGTEKIKNKNQRNINIKNQNTERSKPSFTKKIQVENADLYKPVPNKTMTTRKNCIKYNFVAPLRAYFETLMTLLLT